MKKNKDLWARVSELTQRNILPQQEVSLPAIEEMPMVPEDAASLYLGEPVDVSMNREPQGAREDLQDAIRRAINADANVDLGAFAGPNGKVTPQGIQAYQDEMAKESQRYLFKEMLPRLKNQGDWDALQKMLLDKRKLPIEEFKLMEELAPKGQLKGAIASIGSPWLSLSV